MAGPSRLNLGDPFDRVLHLMHGVLVPRSRALIAFEEKRPRSLTVGTP